MTEDEGYVLTKHQIAARFKFYLDKNDNLQLEDAMRDIIIILKGSGMPRAQFARDVMKIWDDLRVEDMGAT